MREGIYILPTPPHHDGFPVGPTEVKDLASRADMAQGIRLRLMDSNPLGFDQNHRPQNEQTLVCSLKNIRR